MVRRAERARSSGRERGGTTLVRRERPRERPPHDEQPAGGTTLVRRPPPAEAPRSGAHARPEARPGRAASPAATRPAAPPPTARPAAPAPAARPAAPPPPPRPPAPQPFDLSAWARGLGTTARDDTPAVGKERVEPAAPEPRPALKVERFDLGAWVFGIVPRPEETPAEPFRQGLLRREPPPRRPAPGTPAAPPPSPAPSPAPPPPPAPTPPPCPRPGGFDLASWVFGLVPRGDDEPEKPRRPLPPPPRRKALTMPDLFEGGAAPPCLDDD